MTGGASKMLECRRSNTALRVIGSILWLAVNSPMLIDLRSMRCQMAFQQLPACVAQLVVSLAQRWHVISLRIIHLPQLRNDGSRVRIANDAERGVASPAFEHL